MRLHGEFEALRPSAKHLEKAMNANRVFDGAYARVVPLTDFSVLKATSCSATNLLFEKLVRAKSNTPLNLPAVVRNYGPVLKDDIGQIHNVWEVERLFPPLDTDGMRIARIKGKGALSELKPAYASQWARLTVNYLEDLQDALRAEQARYGDESDWQASAQIATSMSIMTTGTLSTTFRFLANFVQENRVSLDLLGAGNILLNLFGEPCLSDAVWVNPLSPQRVASPTRVETCFGALVPEQVNGNRMVMRPRVSYPIAPEHAKAWLSRAQGLGLRPTALQWASAELIDFLGQAEQIASIHSLSEVAANLRANRYTELFQTASF